MWIDPEWRSQAKCRNLGIQESDEMFFLSKGRRPTEAKKFCKGEDGVRCPSFQSCLLYAVLYEEAGIWAATTESDRKYFNPEIKAEIHRQMSDAGMLESRKIEDFVSVVSRVKDVIEVIEPCTRPVTSLRDTIDSIDNRLNALIAA